MLEGIIKVNSPHTLAGMKYYRRSRLGFIVINVISTNYCFLSSMESRLGKRGGPEGLNGRCEMSVKRAEAWSRKESRTRMHGAALVVQDEV